MANTDSKELETHVTNILVEVARSKNIKNYELKPDLNVEVGDGFVSHFYKGEIVNKDSGEIITVAVKKAPAATPMYRDIFFNEITFYSKVLPSLREMQHGIEHLTPFDNTPGLFAYGFEPSNVFIALEHLKPKGYVMYDKKEYLDRKHLECIFQTYGRFHALSFVLRKQNFERYQEVHQSYIDQFHILIDENGSKYLMKASFSAAVNSLDPDSTAYKEANGFLKNLEETFMKTIKYNGDYRCSTHGDCWSNNMLFKYSESGDLMDMKLIDFQLARDGTPIHDLSYFFYSGASKADFDLIDDYLNLYHTSFSEVVLNFGEDPEELFPLKTLIKEWKENALLGVFLGIFLWQFKLLPKEKFLKFIGRSNANDDQTKQEIKENFMSAIKKIHESDTFRKRTKDILIHAFEYGVLKEH